MYRSTRYLRAFGATALVVLLATACGGTDRANHHGTPFTISDSTPKPAGDIDAFSWALYAEPPTLDYIQAFDYPQNTVLSNICDSLMRWTPDLKIEPGLATSVAQPNPTTFVYTIRPNVKFHDGTTMTADDVVYSLERHLNPELGSFWISTFKNVTSITATGPMEVTIALKQPDALFPQQMANSSGTVASRKFLESQGDKYGTATGLGCSGPFTLDAWTKGESIELRRFDGYWGTRAKSDRVTFKFLPDTSSSLNAMLTGEVDGGFGIDPASHDRLSASGVGALYFGKSLTTINLNVIDLQGPLGDVRVRRALQLALDTEGFIKSGLKGIASVTNANAPRDSWPDGTAESAYSGLPATGRDIAQARQLIEQAGASGKTITMVSSPFGPDVEMLAQAYASAGTEIGLNVELKTVSPDAYTALFSDATAREGIDAFPETFYLSVTDPLQLYTNFETGNFQNYQGYSNPAYDALVAEASAEYDPVKRAAITAKLQQLASTELLWVPIVEWPSSMFVNKRITGSSPSISYMYYPWAADMGAAN